MMAETLWIRPLPIAFAVAAATFLTVCFVRVRFVDPIHFVRMRAKIEAERAKDST